jgi:hypothetical protein
MERISSINLANGSKELEHYIAKGERKLVTYIDVDDSLGHTKHNCCSKPRHLHNFPHIDTRLWRSSMP